MQRIKKNSKEIGKEVCKTNNRLTVSLLEHNLWSTIVISLLLFLFSKRSQLAAKSEEKRMFPEGNFIPKISCERSDEYET